MSFRLPDFDIIAQKDIEETHELLKLKEKQKGVIALVLTQKDTESGTIFGGHNWDEIGRHPAMVEEYYRSINSQDEFFEYSTKVRRSLQDLIEKKKI